MAEMDERGDDLASPDAPGEEHDVHPLWGLLEDHKEADIAEKRLHVAVKENESGLLGQVRVGP
eukprot:8233561-Pyramimonas_sp.AAC.1